jgi:signal transduction histidine kinase
MTAGRWRHRHSFAWDVLLAVFFVLLDTGTTLVGASWWPEHPGTLAWVLLGAQALACGTLVLRRRAPLLVLAALGGFTLAVTLLISPAGALTPAHPGTVWAPFSTALAAYGPLYYCSGSNRRTALAALAGLTVVVARPWEPSAAIMSIGLLRTAVGPLLALYFNARRRLVLALTERAERAERERFLLAEQARDEERVRLAGEMHDVVTHRVSLMVLQAGALRMTAKDEPTRQAAEDLRAAGCQALDELRDLVGILRRSPDDEDTTPAVEGLPTLIAESAAAGIPTELFEEGERSLASPVVGRTAYRIVREALTNVRKHAPESRVEVHIVYEQAQLSVAIRNTRPSGIPSSALAGTGSGLGISYLRQRVELVHGTLRAGPEPDGGFGLEATLPAYVPTAESAVRG